MDYSEKYGHTGVSSYDLPGMSRAQQEKAPLLTGDRKLHQICIQQNVEVHGTIWLIEEIYKGKKANRTIIEKAYAKMREDGSRLSWDEVDNQLKRYRNKKR